jgi:S2P endopeptidase
MATLSLYLFNLLPLPLLDGTQLLDAVLDFALDGYGYGYPDGGDEVDLEALDGLGRGDRGRRYHRIGRWKGWIGKMVKIGTMGLSVSCVGLGVINWLAAG